MSYQFEDDSALEQLLNRQLERRQTSSASNISRTNPLTSTANIPPSATNLQTAIPSSITTAEVSSRQFAQRPATATNFASWLSSNDSRQVPDSMPIESLDRQQQDTKRTLKKSREVKTSKLKSSKATLKNNESNSDSEENANDDDESEDENGSLTEESNLHSNSKAQKSTRKFDFDDLSPKSLKRMKIYAKECQKLSKIYSNKDELNKMTKQKLISIVGDEFGAKLNELSKLTLDAIAKLAKFQDNKNNFYELKTQEAANKATLGTEEQKLKLKIDQLEAQLDNSKNQYENDKANIESSFNKQLELLQANYKAQLEQSIKHNNEMLERQLNFQRQELESKFAVGDNLSSLDVIFSEWQLKLQQSIKAFETAVLNNESLLKRQAGDISIKSQNVTDGLRELNQHFESMNELRCKLEDFLMNKQRKIVDDLTGVKDECLKVTKESSLKLTTMLETIDNLRLELKTLQEERCKLDELKMKLESDKCQLQVEVIKVELEKKNSMDTQRANELLREQLEQQTKVQADKSKELSSYETKALVTKEEIAIQTRKLQSLHGDLTTKFNSLTKLKNTIDSDRKQIKRQVKKLENDKKNLVELRHRTSSEMKQLERVHKSLVCSLCLDRLFKFNDYNFDDNSDELHSNKLNAKYQSRHQQKFGGSSKVAKSSNIDKEIRQMLKYQKRDERTLADETNYARLLLSQSKLGLKLRPVKMFSTITNDKSDNELDKPLFV